MIDGRLITKQGNLRVQCRKVIELAEQFRFVRLEFYQLLREQITISLSGRKFTFGLRDLRVQRLDGSRQFIELQSQSILLRFKFGDSPGTIVRVILAKDGFEALRIYKEMGKRIGLVILDFFLPVMDGDVVFDELRALNPSINVVLSSGFAEQTKLGAMLAQGLRGFIPKPYTSEKLLAQVRSVLDAARSPGR